MGASTEDRTLTAVKYTTLLLGVGLLVILLAGLRGWHREIGPTSHFDVLQRALEIAPLLAVIELGMVVVLLFGFLIVESSSES